MYQDVKFIKGVLYYEEQDGKWYPVQLPMAIGGGRGGRGTQGQQGNQGIQGPAGADGGFVPAVTDSSLIGDGSAGDPLGLNSSYGRLYYDGDGYQTQGLGVWRPLTFSAIENNTPDISLNADNSTIEFVNAGKYKFDFCVFGRTTDFTNFEFRVGIRNGGTIDDKNTFQETFADSEPVHEVSGTTILDIAASGVVTLELFNFNGEAMIIGNGFCGISVIIIKVN